MSNSNTSATGGYLFETGAPPQNDESLRRFIHDVIAGVTCLDNELVRPGWDRNPQPIPGIDTDWVSFSIVEQRPDNEPWQGEEDDVLCMIRHEEVDVLCNFYGPNTQSFAGILRDGMYLSQNRDQLTSVGMGLVGFSATIHVPELLNDRYFDRTDITMTLRREIRREYPILSFLGVDGQINVNRGDSKFVENFNVVE